MFVYRRLKRNLVQRGETALRWAQGATTFSCGDSGSSINLREAGDNISFKRKISLERLFRRSWRTNWQQYSSDLKISSNNLIYNAKK